MNSMKRAGVKSKYMISFWQHLESQVNRFHHRSPLSKFPPLSIDASFDQHAARTPQEKITLQNRIFVIDFNSVDSFRDPVETSSCIEVMVRHNGKGYLAHLTIDSDPARFVQKLLKIVGSPAPVCLAGGESSVSEEFLAGLISELQKKGFTVSIHPPYADLLGLSINRQSTLFEDHVEVDHHEGKTWVIPLYFPPDPKK